MSTKKFPSPILTGKSLRLEVLSKGLAGAVSFLVSSLYKKGKSGSGQDAVLALEDKGSKEKYVGVSRDCSCAFGVKITLFELEIAAITGGPPRTASACS